jgi:hypothetical protein
VAILWTHVALFVFNCSTTYKEQSSDRYASIGCVNFPSLEVCQCAGRPDVIQIACGAHTAMLDMWPVQKRTGRIPTSYTGSHD